MTVSLGPGPANKARAQARSHKLSRAQIVQFHRDGYLRLPGFFARDEIAPLAEALEVDMTAEGHAFKVDDGPSSNHIYLGWVDPGDDLLGTFTTIDRVVSGAEALLGQDVYHYHSKIVVKPPHNDSIVGWHHDFAGWYDDGCVAPDMLTCLVAVTPGTKQSGCLRVLKGSHRIGRISLGRRFTDEELKSIDPKDQAYGDMHPRRLQALYKRYEIESVELAPGDALYFHSMTMHSSLQNTTDRARIFIEMTYNAADNSPVLEGQEHHQSRPLNRLPDSTIKEHAYAGVFGRTHCLSLDEPAGAQIFLGNHPKAK